MTLYGLTLKEPTKKASENVVICYKYLINITNLSIETSSLNPDKIKWSGATLFVNEVSKTF